MSAWVTIPCLLALRNEFDAVAPGRFKGADGTIGDSNHSSTSDHTPDEDSDVLRGKDADSKNEVHALDIDSSGPWPGGAKWFDTAIKGIVQRHRTGKDDRLHYVIWDKRIAGESTEWEWVTYRGTNDPHTNHAHFSAKYLTRTENDTSSWGVNEGDDDMNWNDEITLTPSTQKEFGDTDGKMTIGTLLQTIGIWAARAGKNSGTLLDRFKVVTDADSSPQQKADALRVLLGDDAKNVGQILAG